MKTEFKARPVYLSNDERTKAHFTTCFIALTIYRILEKKLQNEYTTTQILKTLKNMGFYYIHGNGYIPCYERTKLTDDLHNLLGFRTDHEIVTTDFMKKLLQAQKNKILCRI